MSSLPPITGTGNMTAPSARILPAGPPHTYLGIAQQMVAGAKVLASDPGAAPIAMAFVSAHGLECILKGYLARHGNDDHLMGKNLRHNLNALWELAASEGLPIAPSPPLWADMLSGLHNRPYHLRYSTGVHGLQTPAATPMVAELEQLLKLVAANLMR